MLSTIRARFGLDYEDCQCSRILFLDPLDVGEQIAFLEHNLGRPISTVEATSLEGKEDRCSPLYLRLFAQNISPVSTFPGDIQSAYDAILDRLVALFPGCIPAVLKAIYCSGGGMFLSQLLEIASTTDGVFIEDKMWLQDSMLCLLIRTTTSSGEGEYQSLVNFVHMQARDAVGRRWFLDVQSHAQAHANCVAFFLPRYFAMGAMRPTIVAWDKKTEIRSDDEAKVFESDVLWRQILTRLPEHLVKNYLGNLIFYKRTVPLTIRSLGWKWKC